MRIASFCSGIAAPEVAWAPLGFVPVVMCEIAPFPRAVLHARHSAGEAWGPALWDDLWTYGAEAWHHEALAEADVLVAGTPCQSFSVAGRLGGLDDPRGQLALEYGRIADDADRARRAAGRSAPWVLWENVPNVLSHRSNAFGHVLGRLVGSGALAAPADGRWPRAGVACGPTRCAAWRVLDARHFGVPQRRRRVFLLARGYFGGAGSRDAARALLPVLPSDRRHREARGPAPSTGAGSGGMPDVANTLIAYGDGPRVECTYVPFALHGRQDPGPGGYITHALDTNGGSIVAVDGRGARRLTPLEWERLQGFPDGYTAIDYRGRPAADTPRYKAIGNSMAVPVVRWIGEQMQLVDALNAL